MHKATFPSAICSSASSAFSYLTLRA
jgi:hypothetical protein